MTAPSKTCGANIMPPSRPADHVQKYFTCTSIWCHTHVPRVCVHPPKWLSRSDVWMSSTPLLHRLLSCGWFVMVLSCQTGYWLHCIETLQTCANGVQGHVQTNTIAIFIIIVMIIMITIILKFNTLSGPQMNHQHAEAQRLVSLHGEVGGWGTK